MAAGVEPAEWDSDTVSRFLGLEGLGEEAKANIAEPVAMASSWKPSTLTSSSSILAS